MNTVAMMEQRKKIHPHKFTLWIAIGSIVMMFAGFTSAYIVKRNQANWVSFELPKVLWFATATILLSSITLMLALRNFKQRQMLKHRSMMAVTFFLGVLFMSLQIVGFSQLTKSGITFTGNVSYSFLYTIIGIHAAHVLGGVIALGVMFAKTFQTKKRNYSSVPVELISTYWHFVDILWIYLLIFLLMIR